MTLKQVEPVEYGDMEFSIDGQYIAIHSTVVCDEGAWLTEPEARALLEWLKRVCEI